MAILNHAAVNRVSANCESTILFAGKNDEMMAFNQRISTFILDGLTFQCGFPAVGKLTDSSYYQLLTDGKAKLLKHLSKTIQGGKSYGTTEAVFNL